MNPLLYEFLINEISSNALARISQNVDPEDLPFNDIFNGKKRIMIPLKHGLLEQIQKFYKELDVEVDPERAVAIETKETKRGPKQVEQKLGKKMNKDIKSLTKEKEEAAQNVAKWAKENGIRIRRPNYRDLPEEEEILEPDNPDYEKELSKIVYQASYIGHENEAGVIEDFWTIVPDKLQRKVFNVEEDLHKLIKYNDMYNKTGGGMSVIISRAPVDILRMSDFKNVQSCHSEGGSYFNCAIQEANDGGAVAFIVKNSDAKNIDLDKPEIFQDKGRKIEGATPVARVRLRRFDDKYSGEKLLMPETRIYGSSYSGFLESVTDWAFDAQKAKFTDEDGYLLHVDMDDYERAGGAYSDTASSELFNNFFGTDEYYGDVGAAQVAEIYAEEAAEYDRQYNDFENISVGYDMSNDYEEEPYVIWGADTYIPLPEDENVKESFVSWVKNGYRDNKSPSIYDLKNYLNKQTYYISVENFYVDDRGITIRLYIEDSVGGPDDYYNFLTGEAKGMDEEYPKLLAAFRQFLIEYGYMDGSVLDNLYSTIDIDEDIELENFETHVDEDEYTITLESVYGVLKNPGNVRLFWDRILSGEFNEIMKNIVFNSLGGDARQLMLPGFEEHAPVDGKSKYTGFVVLPRDSYVMPKHREEETPSGLKWKFFVTVKMIDHSPEEARKLINLLNHLDEKWDAIEEIGNKALSELVHDLGLIRPKSA